jgi:Protein of unknown function (DUF3616)
MQKANRGTPSNDDLIKASPFEDRNGKQAHNASEVVAIADSRFLFCDNNISDSLFEMRLTKTGAMAGPLIRRRIIGVSPRYLDDFEGMAVARDGTTYYLVVATSFSLKVRSRKARKKSGRGKPAIERESLLRITAAESAEPQAEIIPGFRGWLIEQAPDLGKAWRKSWSRIPDDGGLNMEGLAWNPIAMELLFGLRTPVIDGKPVILRVRVKNIGGTWNLNNFEMMPPVFLDLVPGDSERGIRTMEFDPSRNGILIVTGNSTSQSQAPFELYQWDGNPKGKVKRFDGVRFDPKFRVEGVTPGTIAGRPALIFVDDRGGYQVLWGDDKRLNQDSS